jgi:para-nitrobenzyl esterase
MYIFTHGTRDNNMALHTVEIPFVFGILDTKDIADGGIEINEESKQLAKNVMDAWVAFARTGNPNHDDLPLWPPYDLDERATMILGIKSSIVQDPMNELRLLWDDLL